MLNVLGILIEMDSRIKITYAFLCICLVACFVAAACSLTVQVQRDTCNSSQTDSQSTENSADSASVNLKLR